MGYDPGSSKPQASSQSIQQTRNSSPSLVVNPQDPEPHSGVPAGYTPATSQNFAPSLESDSPRESAEQHDQVSIIDPSIQGIPPSDVAGLQIDVDGSAKPQVNAPPAAPAAPAPPAPPADSSNSKSMFAPFMLCICVHCSFSAVKHVRISDLVALRGIAPPAPHAILPIPPSRLDEVKAIYLAAYAPAADRFLETRWFEEKGLSHLMGNEQLMADFSALIEAFNDTNLNDPNGIARLESFEASIVWSIMGLCRHITSVANGGDKPDSVLVTASARLHIVEALITGDHMERNPLEQSPVREPALSFSDQIVQRSLDFWSSIGHYLTLHDDEASSAKEIDDTLARSRALLDTFENRDVIYSIAIARHLGQRWADFPNSFPHAITTNEKDVGAKLYVAQKFLEQEASGKATNQVVKRICGMVTRSWIVCRG